ncbi:chromosome segregation protein SMC [bacterium]|nr:chromosome segregation protein SMC [bacterium]
MQLISLNISGFKSFAIDTAIQFSPGVTGVVGPNGCGKSNVVDALRWVLGEQRSSVLRGERMENVIFNGTQRRKPLNLAEVKVKFDNSSGRINLPYTEIEIARRLHRDGSSEYMLNGNTCRLRDITDMLQDSGLGPNAYTILELKMIEDILREDGEGRRQLFEEASGIAKYKLRRRQAQAKLDQTQEDLVRLADIISEVERQVASLKRQVSRANRYKELTNQLHSAETAFMMIEHRRLTDELRPMRASLSDSATNADSNTGYLRQLEAELEMLRAKQVEADSELTELRKTLQEVVARISSLEAEKAGLEARLQGARDTIERAQRQRVLSRDRLESLAARKDVQSRESEDLTLELQDCESRLAEAAARFSSTETELRRLEANFKEADGELAALRRSGRELEQRRTELAEKIATMKGRRESAANTVEQSVQERKSLNLGIQSLTHRLSEADLKYRDAHDNMQSVQRVREEILERMETLKSRKSDLERLEHAARSHVNLLHTLEQKGPRAARNLACLRESLQQPQVLVADLAVVTDKYQKAIHTALGSTAYYVVAEESEAIQSAIGVLRQAEAGKSGFVPLAAFNALAREKLDAPAAALGWAIEFVEAGEHGNLLAALLQGCLIVDSLEVARTLAPFLREHRCRAISLAGDWLDGSGICYAGGAESDTPTDLGLAKQIDALHESLASIAVEQTDLAVTADSIDREFSEWRGLHNAAQSALDECRKEAEIIKEDSVRQNALLQALILREQAASEQVAECDMATVNFRKEMEGISTQSAELQSKDSVLQKEVETLATLVGMARQTYNVAREEMHDREKLRDAARHRLELLSAEGERLQTQEKELIDAITSSDALAEESANQARSFEQRLQEITPELDSLFRERDRRARAVDSAHASMDGSRGEVSSKEEQIKRLRNSREAALEDQRKFEIAIAKLEGELEALVSSARNGYDLDLSDPELFERNAALLKSEIGPDTVKELRTKIENLGAVNLLAVEEFETETKRLDQMLASREDLLQAKATLEETIQKINETAEAKFLHTFEAVRANFQGLFAEFFPAGEADLILSGKDLLDADITMWANPSGKRLKSLTLMSGGEKTMTAIALLFSLYQVKPSPFCVLDEVDAPLDDANIDRFTRMIHRHSDHTQFIMITHNKRTMEIADNLYGVTMQEEGVSKMVSVRLHKPQAPEIATEKAAESAT